MQTETVSFRPSMFLLDRVLNPAGDDDLNRWQPAHLLEACGVIPDFFVEACITAETESADAIDLDAIADGMDRIYQFGGFEFPWGGTVSPEGVYHADNEEDAPLSPLVRFAYALNEGGRAFELFVYDYGITAIRERGSDAARVARFD